MDRVPYTGFFIYYFWKTKRSLSIIFRAQLKKAILKQKTNFRIAPFRVKYTALQTFKTSFNLFKTYILWNRISGRYDTLSSRQISILNIKAMSNLFLVRSPKKTQLTFLRPSLTSLNRRFLSIRYHINVLTIFTFTSSKIILIFFFN